VLDKNARVKALDANYTQARAEMTASAKYLNDRAGQTGRSLAPGSRKLVNSHLDKTECMFYYQI
jgi:hypothetical protein